MPDIKELLEMSPPVALMLGLNFLMWLLKYSFPAFPRNKIPIVCALIGTVVFPIIGSDGKVPYDIPHLMLAKSLFGFILGTSSVGLHQIFLSQLQKRFGIQLPGETEIIVKTSDNQSTKVEVKSPDPKIEITQTLKTEGTKADEKSIRIN